MAVNDDKDHRVISIPLYGCSQESLKDIGLVVLGDAPRIHPEDPPYLLVTLPEGWSYVQKGTKRGDGLIVDDRSITRAFTGDDHRTCDRIAYTSVLNVGTNAAGQLYGRGATLEDIKFDELTPEEIEELVVQLERAAEGKDGIGQYPENVRKAKEWLHTLAVRSHDSDHN